MHRIGGCHADALHHVACELGRVLIKRAGNVWFPGNSRHRTFEPHRPLVAHMCHCAADFAVVHNLTLPCGIRSSA